MSEVLLERGIGETRAIVVAGGTIVEAYVDRDDGRWRAGDVRDVRLTTLLVAGVRGIVAANGIEAILVPVPPAVTEGMALRVEVVREAIGEAGRDRLAKVVRTTAPVGAGPSLAARLGVHDAVGVVSHGRDRLEEFGWSEVVDSAETGRVTFPGGLLTISPTPAMTVIDVDGDLPPAALALAAADAAAAAIRRFDITGSIAIDFPTVGDRAVRAAIGDRLDSLLPRPFERTAVNGFGLAQIVRPRRRASLIEVVRADPAATAALRLLRQAERHGSGAAVLVVAAGVERWLTAHRALIGELARRRGGPVDLHVDPAIAMAAGYVAAPS